MLKKLLDKIKKNFKIYSGETMLIDKEGELWKLNEKDETVKISEEENNSKDINSNPNKN